MTKQAKAGPLYMPWQSGHYEEIVVFVIAGLLGAIIGATLIAHYRKRRGTT